MQLIVIFKQIKTRLFIYTFHKEKKTIFLKFSNEIRRELIHQYRLKRDAAKEYKQAYERCYQQIDVKF